MHEHPLDPHQVRIIRLASQGFGSIASAPPATVVAKAGFVRTLGGCDAYLAVRARQRTLHRGELDTAVERGELRVVPAARGCIYLVPRADVPLCLRFAEQMTAARNAREFEKAGLARGEVDAVAAAALATLRRNGPLTTDALRKAMPEGSVRSLGDAGKKVGISSPLPAALRQLEFAGSIERSTEGGRLDTERYVWRATTVNPFDGADLPSDPVQLHARLFERYLAFAGVATLPQFSAWSGLAQRDARAAIEQADALTVTIPGEAAEAFTTAGGIDKLMQQHAVDAAAAFLPFEDNAVHLYGGPAHLTDPQYHGIAVPSWPSGKPETIAQAAHLSMRGLIADGQLSGFWEYDPDSKLAMPRCFRKPSKAAQVLIEEIAMAVSAFLRDEIGHGRSFSLDTDDELRNRVRQLAKIDGKKIAPTKVRASAPAKSGSTKQARKLLIPRPAAKSKAAAKSKPKPKSKPKSKPQSKPKSPTKAKAKPKRTRRS